MSSEETTTSVMKEILLEKDQFNGTDFKDESFNSDWFTNEQQTLNAFKEELLFDEAFEWKPEVNDFNVEELLGSYLAETMDDFERGRPEKIKDETTSIHHLAAAEDLIQSSTEITTDDSVKEDDDDDDDDDLDALKDMLPFGAVMESLDLNNSAGFETAASSDSGLSSADNNTEFMLSPSNSSFGGGSPSAMDTTDSASEVSSTSDLGSMGSVGGGSPTGRSSSSTTPLRFDIGDNSPSIVAQFDEDVDMKSLPMPLQTTSVASSSDKASVILCTSPSSSSLTTKTIPGPRIFQQTTATKLITSATSTSSSPPTVVTIAPTTSSPITAARSVKLELSHNSVTRNSNPSIRSPVLAKVRLDSNGVLTTKGSVPSSTSQQQQQPQTIVVTQAAGKVPSSSVIRSGTILKAGTGRPILVPVNVNVNDLNQVKKMKSFKIISGGSRPGVSGIRTLVSTVRPISTPSPVPSSSLSSSSNSSSTSGGSTTTSATSSRTTFYTTSKGSDGRPLLKVAPTAFVPPTTHTISVTPSYVKEEDPSDDESPQPNQELVLTEEERRLMRKEGLILPSRYPLTKQEERDLKRIRRKIRNKISAQDSRKRKKEYVDGLEDRVKTCTEENQQLQKRIKSLEKQNETLLAQLKKLHRLIGVRYPYNNSRQQNHASTALMMLILSAALFVVPSLRSQDGKGENELSRDSKMPSSGHSRNLLEVKNSALNMQTIEGFSEADDDALDSIDFSTNALSDHDYAPVSKKARFESITDLFTPPNTDKTLPRQNGDPPDGLGNLNGVAAMIGSMLDRLGNNWTDPGGSLGSSINLTSHHGAPERSSSVVVNLNHGKRMRDDIELE